MGKRNFLIGVVIGVVISTVIQVFFMQYALGHRIGGPKGPPPWMSGGGIEERLRSELELTSEQERLLAPSVDAFKSTLITLRQRQLDELDAAIAKLEKELKSHLSGQQLKRLEKMKRKFQALRGIRHGGDRDFRPPPPE